ncbi:MAG: type II toxin-antitoxin system RelE/ParE family toxin [Capsulimonas sp.]|uniref:type II toxin-antitoxin system RelE/ParE family toxin n=1 Tax=Capsulimonas sp. TaxID=2494211 RepID=UPI003263A4D1
MSERYSIVLQPEAVQTMEIAYEFIKQDSPQHAQRWLRGLEEAIRSLDAFPTRCPLAPESELFPQEIRQLLYGKNAGVYRILFTVDNQVVNVLHIRHAAQQWIFPTNSV